MSKATAYYLLDIVLALLAVLLGVSSLLLWVVFPRGYMADRLLWVEVHKWNGLALGLAVLLHLALHWRWLLHMTWRYLVRVRSVECQTTKRLLKLPTRGGPER